MLLDQGLRFSDLFWLEAEVRRQFNGRLDPELGLTVCVLNVHVCPNLLA
jgi:hypothetical protein